MADVDQIDNIQIPEGHKKKKGGGFQAMNLKRPIFKAIMAKGFNVPTPI